MDSDGAALSALWQGEGRKRRHVDFVEAQCPACGTTQAVASENSSFRCASGHSYTFFRCAQCKATFQCAGIGNPCPYCLSVQRDGQVTAWEWAADQIRHPELVSFQPQWTQAAETSNDVDRRTLYNFILAACGGSQIPAEANCNVVFARDAITIHPTGTHAVTSRAETVRYEDAVALQVTGTTTRKHTRIIGGGFGVVQAAEGMLTAAVINSLTNQKKIFTLLRLATTTSEYVFVSYSVDSKALELLLTPVQVRIRKAHSTSPQPQMHPAPSTGQSVADEIRKLAALRDEGIISDDEFAGAKTRLLGSA